MNIDFHEQKKVKGGKWQLINLFLESKNIGQTALNRIIHPTLCLIIYGIHRIRSFIHWHFL